MRTSTLWKIISLGSIATVAHLSGVAFADVLYDCSLVAIANYNAIDALKLPLTAPLTKADAQGALNDLKAYCCQIGTIVEGCQTAKESTTNPESPYIFDQLVSKGFFKLDNKVDGSKDSKATERSEKVTERQDGGNGKVPVGIQNTFEQIRQPNRWQSASINDATCEITNYNNLNLAARYTAVCMQSACITSKFLTTTIEIGQRYDTLRCDALTRKRIEDEMKYVQTLMVRKTNTLMNDVRSTYTQSYLLETRRGGLIDKFSRIDESLSAVNGKVQEGTRMCSG